MKAVNHGSPTDITITWDKPRDEVLNQLAHYRVTYETISVAGQPVVNSTQSSVNVSADSQKVSLKDLATYTTYKITVKPVMRDDKVENKKVIFASIYSDSSLLCHSFYGLIYYYEDIVCEVTILSCKFILETSAKKSTILSRFALQV